MKLWVIINEIKCNIQVLLGPDSRSWISGSTRSQGLVGFRHQAETSLHSSYGGESGSCREPHLELTRYLAQVHSEITPTSHGYNSTHPAFMFVMQKGPTPAQYLSK